MGKETTQIKIIKKKDHMNKKLEITCVISKNHV